MPTSSWACDPPRLIMWAMPPMHAHEDVGMAPGEWTQLVETVWGSARRLKKPGAMLEQIVSLAKKLKGLGATGLRGGAFKPRTSPYSFQGHKELGLKMLATARAETGLAIVTEVIFALPGMGGLGLTAILDRDYPVVQGVALVVAAGYVLANLLVDLTYTLVDPRTRVA